MCYSGFVGPFSSSEKRLYMGKTKNSPQTSQQAKLVARWNPVDCLLKAATMPTEARPLCLLADSGVARNA